MRTRHYHVLFSTAGYMPDSNDVCRTKQDALASTRWWRDVLREDFPRDDGWIMSGSIDNGGYVWNIPDAHTLPRILEWVECSDACCLDAMED